MARFLGVFPDEPEVLDVIVVDTRREAAMMGYTNAALRKAKPKSFPAPIDSVQWRNNF